MLSVVSRDDGSSIGRLVGYISKCRFRQETRSFDDGFR